MRTWGNRSSFRRHSCAFPIIRRWPDGPLHQAVKPLLAELLARNCILSQHGNYWMTHDLSAPRERMICPLSSAAARRYPSGPRRLDGQTATAWEKAMDVQAVILKALRARYTGFRRPTFSACRSAGFDVRYFTRSSSGSMADRALAGAAELRRPRGHRSAPLGWPLYHHPRTAAVLGRLPATDSPWTPPRLVGP